MLGDLLEDYKITLKKTKHELKIREQLLKNYTVEKAMLHDLQIYLAIAYSKPTGLQDDITQLRAFIRSLEFSIEWLETGRQPGTSRGVEKKDVYKKRRHVDSMKSSYSQLDLYPSEKENVRDEETIHKEKLVNEIVKTLTVRQRDVLDLHARKYTETDIASMLGTSQQYISKTISTCRDKIKKEGWVML